MKKKYYLFFYYLLIVSLIYSCNSRNPKISDSQEIADVDTAKDEKQKLYTDDTLKYIYEGLQGENIIGYWLNTPGTYNETQKLPILIFLHGGGMGENPDVNRLKSYGPLKHVLTDSISVSSSADILKKFLIVCPVLPENLNNFTLWIDNIETLDAIIDSIVANYQGDLSRIYISGSSRGGSGAWRFPKYSRHSIAAIVPVCGYFMELSNLNVLVDIPVWATCNTGDYHFNNHKKAILYIEELGGEKFLTLNTVTPDNKIYLEHIHIFTSFDKKGHDAWTETYASRDIYNWMLNFQNIEGDIKYHKN